MKVGFDLWGTLIKSNPLFLEAKQTLFKQYFPDIYPENFIQAQKFVKQGLDGITERTGYQSDISMRRNLLISYLGLDINDSGLQRRMSQFLDAYQKLFILFPPNYFSDETHSIFEEIKEFVIEQDHKSKIVLISNTVFNGHSSMKPVIDSMFYYTEFVTSDIMKISKPSKGIWDSNLDYFIGDNPITDGGYAKGIGAEFIQINTNNKTIKDAYEHIKSTTDR